MREPREVARLLERREGLRRGALAVLWLRYTLDAERDTRGMPARLRRPTTFGDWRGWHSSVARDAGYRAAGQPCSLPRGDRRFLDPT